MKTSTSVYMLDKQTFVEKKGYRKVKKKNI